VDLKTGRSRERLCNQHDKSSLRDSADSVLIFGAYYPATRREENLWIATVLQRVLHVFSVVNIVYKRFRLTRSF
jgi:hypothetical protein